MHQKCSSCQVCLHCSADKPGRGVLTLWTEYGFHTLTLCAPCTEPIVKLLRKKHGFALEGL